jgi:hypothetical protein
MVSDKEIPIYTGTEVPTAQRCLLAPQAGSLSTYINGVK